MITRSKWRPELVGQTCDIIGPYEEPLCVSPSGTEHWLYRYLVRLLGGETGAISFRNLKPLAGESARQRTAETVADGKSKGALLPLCPNRSVTWWSATRDLSGLRQLHPEIAIVCR